MRRCGWPRRHAGREEVGCRRFVLPGRPDERADADRPRAEDLPRLRRRLQAGSAALEV